MTRETLYISFQRVFYASLLLILCPSGFAQNLQVGLAQVEMKMPLDVPMWGYLPARPSTGTLDPLYARIFVFQTDEHSMALVQLDLGRTFGEAQMNSVRKEVAEATGIHEVIFTATHTHSGPAVFDTYEGGTPPGWEREALTTITQGIIKASKETFAAKLGYGSGTSWIGFNRRYVRADGSVKMLWANPTKISTYPIDPEVQVLRIDDMEGNAKGLIVGHACHPVVFGPDNAEYSADFPGEMAKYVSEHMEGQPMVSFFQGGCGDINPYMDKRRIEANGVNLMKEVGIEIGKDVKKVAEKISTKEADSVSLQVQVDTLHFADRVDPSKQYETKLTVFVLNDQYAFVGYPGEPFVEFQRELKRMAGMPAFFMGYTNGYFRYFPTIRASVEGGYGARGPVAVVEVGAGERLLYRGLNILYRMTGKLGDTPR